MIPTINYEPSMGKIRWQEGFKNELIGKSIEEQIHCYAWSKYDSYNDIPWTMLEETICKSEYEQKQVSKVVFYPGIKAIVKDGLVVGVSLPGDIIDIHTFAREQLYILAYNRYCYETTSDNNGAGYKERNWYKYLICLPNNHKLF